MHITIIAVNFIDKVGSALKLINLFLRRHLEASPILLFRSLNFSTLIMKNFSAKHRLHLLVLLL